MLQYITFKQCKFIFRYFCMSFFNIKNDIYNFYENIFIIINNKMEKWSHKKIYKKEYKCVYVWKDMEYVFK